MKKRQEFTADLIKVAESAETSDEIVNMIHSLCLLASTLADSQGATEDRYEPDFELIEHVTVNLLGTLRQAYEVNLDAPEQGTGV